MAIKVMVTICDRCGKIIDYPECHITTYKNPYENNIEYYELCNECKDSLENWIKGGIENEQ